MLCLPGPNTTPSFIGRMNKTKQRKMGKEGSYLDRRCLCWIWKPKRKLENSMKQREGTKIPASTWTGGDFVEYENPKWNWKTASRANKNRLGKRLESSTWLNPEHTIVSIFSTMHNQVKLHFLSVRTKNFPPEYQENKIWSQNLLLQQCIFGNDTITEITITVDWDGGAMRRYPHKA